MTVNETIKDLLDREYKLIRSVEFQTKAKDKLPMNPRLVYDGLVGEKFSGVVFLLKEATEKGAQDIENESKKKKTDVGSNELLKAPNNYDDANPWNFIATTQRQAIAQKDSPDKWKPICYWMDAFSDPQKSFNDAHNCGKNLLDVAIVNLKKTTGEGSSENAPLEVIVNNKQ